MNHRKIMFRAVIAIGTWMTISAALVYSADVDFSHDIVPILREHCGQCHTGDKQQGGFSLNTRNAMLAGGESGKAIIVGKSADSELMKRIHSTDVDFQMPPEGPRVPATKIALLKAWIDGGAKWDEGFAFQKSGYDPPLKPRRPDLPTAVMGRNNPVDRIVDAYMAQHGMAPGQPISDAAFMRRVHLDLIGLLPDPQRLASFLADPRSDKRDVLVRELLRDDVAYAEHWLTFWNDLLRNDYSGTGFITQGRKQITAWLYRSLIENKPFDQFTRELISPAPEAEGYIQGIRWRGDVSASQKNEVQFAQSISQSFLGINMKCASCHDSFIDRWKLSDAYGLAAIYAVQPLEIHRCDKPIGVTAQAAWIFPELGQIDPNAKQPERLKQLAQLMTHPENGRFTRTIVNRLWHRLMGRGIVHPVDAMHTEPWSVDLLDYLAVHLVDNGYDLKKTLELICTSRTYQSVTPAQTMQSESGPYVFRGPTPRRLTAEQFVDAVWQMTGTNPTKSDALVVRAKTTVEKGDVAPQKLTTLTGKWIWSNADASKTSPAGETITLRRQIKLSSVPTRAVAVVTCDNEYTLFINGVKVQADANWETVEVVPLESSLKTGPNEIVAIVKNGGGSPNPAAFFFEARLKFTDSADQTLSSAEGWEWTKSMPDGRGRFKNPPNDWKPAVEVKDSTAWTQRVGPQLASLLFQSANAAPRTVRASLMKSDSLMRSLGRPNRDQIVSMRPNDLTTLEAIDLANGPALAEILARGAKKLIADHGDSPTTLVTRLYRFALSRDPNEAETALAYESLGSPLNEQGVQDLLWAILMQPAFQLVR